MVSGLTGSAASAASAASTNASAAPNAADAAADGEAPAWAADLGRADGAGRLQSQDDGQLQAEAW